MKAVTRKNLDRPDQVRDFPRMAGSLVEVGSVSIGRARLEPGWRFSTDVGAAIASPSCQVHHVQLMLSGRMAIQMDGASGLRFTGRGAHQVKGFDRPVEVFRLED